MIQPLFARVLLEREPEKKKGSIIIPKSSQMKFASLRCKVIAIGADVNDETRTNSTINIGDTVLIGKHVGGWLDLDGEPVEDADKAVFYIVQDEDILARIE